MSSKQKPTQKQHLDEFVEVAKDHIDVWHSDDYWIRAIRNKTGNKDYIINQLNFKMGKLSWINNLHKTTSGPLFIATQKKFISIGYDSNGKENEKTITFYYATLDQKLGPNDMPLEDECQSFWRTNIKASSWMRRRKQSVVEI